MQGAGEAVNPLLDSRYATLVSLVDEALKTIVILEFFRSHNGYFLTVTIIYHNLQILSRFYRY